MEHGEPVRLWDGPAPGSETWTHDEQEIEALAPPDGVWVRNVVVPTMTAYLPDSRTDRAVLVCPGGALHFLAADHEGHQVAERIASEGTAAFVLKYRTVPTPDDEEGFKQALSEGFADLEGAIASTLPLSVADAERALEMLRADGYRHVTLLGFSAGARVGTDLMMDRSPDRHPDAAALIYLPWVRMTGSLPDVPPLFVLAASDDPLGIKGSLELQRAWTDAGAPVELHLFEGGGHGFGIHPKSLPVDSWPDLFLAWHRTHTAA